MALKHVWTTSIKADGLPSLPTDAPLTISGNHESAVVEVVASDQVAEVDVGSIDKSLVISIVLNSDLAVVVSTNAANAAGGQVFTLAAKKSFTWNNTQDATLFPNPISNNITKFFIDNTGGAAPATFSASFLMSV